MPASGRALCRFVAVSSDCQLPAEIIEHGFVGAVAAPGEAARGNWMESSVGSVGPDGLDGVLGGAVGLDRGVVGAGTGAPSVTEVHPASSNVANRTTRVRTSGRYRGGVFFKRSRSDRTTELSRPAQKTVGTLIVPSVPLVQQLLDEYGLKHQMDTDGDLVVRWEKCSMYFFFYGENNEVLQARLYLNRRFDVESRGMLTLMLDEWNRTKLFPKVYTVLPDDGMVGICAEHCQDFEAGATRDQVKYTMGMWIETLMRFAEWVDEQV